MDTDLQHSVLVVDDTEANLDILVDILGDDYTVSIAMDGESALESAFETPPDLILLDIMMPGMDGYQVCEQLKNNEATKDIPVIFVTALEDAENETRGLALGAVDYITKPYNPVIVRLRVDNHLKIVRANEILKEQNEILLENARLRDDVERIARHDLKTPLNALMTVPGLLIKEKNISNEQRELLEMLQESGYRVMDIINSSIDLYRMEKGTYDFNPVPVDILRVIRQLKGEIRELMTNKEIGFKILIDDEPAQEHDTFSIMGEEMLYYSMFANLLKNAVEASPAGKKITIGLKEKDENPLFLINNSGMVPEEIRHRFFEKYATFGKRGGTGLGTYSARLIVETLGGKISFQTDQDKGTTLIVQFPRMFNRKSTELMLSSHGASMHRKRNDSIMVVDDYALMRNTIVSILRQMGFSMFHRMEDGHVAWEALETEPVDLIISDFNMPRMNGFEFLKLVRASETFRKVPFLMVTAEAEREYITKAAQLGVTDYIVKPFTADVLMKKINKILG